MEFHATHAGQVALTRLITGLGQQAAVHGHGLGGVFDAVGGAESTFSPQWIGWIEMADGRAGNGRFCPVDHGIEQAHVALMRDAGGDGGVIQHHRTKGWH